MSIWEKIKQWFDSIFGDEGLFSSAQEKHAFLIGISETIAPWKPHFDMPEDYEAGRKKLGLLPDNPLYEYHYYMFGRACGVLVWFWCILPIFCIIMNGIWKLCLP